MASKIEVTYDLGDPVPEGEDMNIDDVETERIKSSASKRKGRGFEKKSDDLKYGREGKFDALEDSHGKAQRSVEGWIVLVTNVHEEITEEDLIDLFQEYGPLKNLHLNLDRRTGYGYALVEYREYSEAKEAIKNLDNFVLHDKKLSCDFAFVRGPAAQQNKK